MKKILILALLMISANSLFADEYLYDTIWNRQIPGYDQMLSADRKTAYSVAGEGAATRLIKFDIETSKVDTIVSNRTFYFSPDLQSYIGADLSQTIRPVSAFRIGDNSLIKVFEKSVMNSKYSPDGKYLVSMESNQANTFHILYVYETQNYNVVFQENISEEATFGMTECISFSPNSKKFMIKSTAPNKPNIITKYHIYEFENWKKFEYQGDYGQGYLRDDDIFIAGGDVVVDYRQNKLIEKLPISFSNEIIGDWKVDNQNIYFTGEAENYAYAFFNKYNFASKKMLRYKYTEGIHIHRIILYNDSIFGTGKNLNTDIGGWFWLKPVISTDITGFGNETITLYPNPTNGRLILTNPQNHQINSLTAYDILGRTYSLTSNGDEVDISSLASGIYYLKVGLADGSFLDFRFVKE